MKNEKAKKTMRKQKLIQRQKTKRRTTKKTHHKNNSNSQTIITTLLKLQAQIKFLHWNTKKYAIHMISDKFHEKISGHIDELVEVFLAQDVKLYPVSKYYENTKDLSTSSTSYESEKENTLTMLEKSIDTINSHSQGLTRDVSAILDVIVTDINRFKYLLSFR